MSNNYYGSQNFYNTKRSVDLAIISHFASMLFNSDQTKVVYSTNDYALRKRSDQNDGSLSLPFLNFKITDSDPGLRPWWNATLYGGGMYLPSLGAKIKMRPLNLNFEGSFWCHRDDERDYAFNQLSWDADNKTIVRGSVTIDEEDVDLPVLLGYDTLDPDPDYNENDWLERNKIHTIRLGFTVETFALIYDGNICITENVLFNLAKNYGQETLNYDETYQWVLDHVLEEKSEV